MDLKQQRFAVVGEAQQIIQTAKAAARDLTNDERTDLEAKQARVAELSAQIDRAEKDAELLKGFESFGAPDEQLDEKDVAQLKSLGAHFAAFVKSDGLARLKAQRGTTITVPEYGEKAATDPNTTPGVFTTPLLTQVDQYMRRGFRRQTITDLFGQGTLGRGTNAVSYFIEGAVEGNFATVAEAAQKPQIHFVDPTMTTDAVRKIAGWWDTADEMIEDLDFWVSEINNRGLYMLSLVEESQVLSGDGTGTNLLGVLNRSGIQTVAQAASADSAQNAIFRGVIATQTATGLTADGIVINPTDYQSLRLQQDANGQYFGGGFFSGAYGQGGVGGFYPPLWGLPTIVSAAVPAKTVLTGALGAAVTVYRKGGVRVESTNSDLGKFTKDIVTTRIEERMALACRMPAGVVKVTLQ